MGDVLALRPARQIGGAVVAQVSWKAIVPRGLNERAMRQKLEEAMRKVGNDFRKDFERTTSTWENKPKFTTEFESSKSQMRVTTNTDDDVYRYVSAGTRPHIIRPRRATRLHFAGTYTAKTAPGVIDAKAGGSGGDEVFSLGVKHPGTKPRHFSKQIAKLWQREFGDRMRAAMRDAARASGHAMRHASP